MDPRKASVSETERQLQEQFNPEYLNRFSSTAQQAAESEYVKDLVLDTSSRGRMPATREDYIVNENPARVEWEREVRNFLRRLNQHYGHRITAPMIYEWATGISIKDLVEAENIPADRYRGGAGYGSANMHLRHINAILREYFGKPYKTTIMGRPVGRAYTVRPQFRVERKKPACLTLWPEYDQGLLEDQQPLKEA